MEKVFDLEKLRSGHKAMLRNGAEYKFGSYSEDVGEGSIIGWIKHKTRDYWEVISHTKDGKFSTDPQADKYQMDIVLCEPEYWVNVFERPGVITDQLNCIVSRVIYTSKSDAERASCASLNPFENLKFVESVRLPVTNTLK